MYRIDLYAWPDVTDAALIVEGNDRLGFLVPLRPSHHGALARGCRAGGVDVEGRGAGASASITAASAVAKSRVCVDGGQRGESGAERIFRL